MRLNIAALLIFLMSFSLLTRAQSTTTQYPYQSEDALAYASPTVIHSYSETEVKDRIASMSSPIVTMKYTPVVASYVKTYALMRREKTEWMLGRTAMYFPLFEKYLTERNLPKELKYLSVVESALNPEAVSRSGAVGLWQFMPPTGKEYGLSINSMIDERKDPHKATKAALTYLSRLYNKFGNWELALAAYNGGPGRVNRAIKRGRSKNFWKIKRYLPKETRNYIPAFIGATYIMSHFDKHQLTPVYPEPDLQLTESTRVYRPITFQQISDVTGVPMKVIEVLNPAYNRRNIPHSSKGNYVTLPQHAMGLFLQFLGRPDTELNRITVSPPVVGTSVANNPNYYKTTYIVNQGDDIYSVADKFKCEPNDIKNWNYLTAPSLAPGLKLIVYMPKARNKWSEFEQLPARNFTITEPEFEPIKQKDIQLLPQPEPIKFSFFKSNKKDKKVYYQLRRRETLRDITKKHPDVTIEDILRLNKIQNEQAIKPGTRLIIKEK